MSWIIYCSLVLKIAGKLCFRGVYIIFNCRLVDFWREIWERRAPTGTIIVFVVRRLTGSEIEEIFGRTDVSLGNRG